MALTALMAMPPTARAEGYPTRNATVLVPFAPGGGTDLLARAYTQSLEKGCWRRKGSTWDGAA